MNRQQRRMMEKQFKLLSNQVKQVQPKQPKFEPVEILPPLDLNLYECKTIQTPS